MRLAATLLVGLVVAWPAKAETQLVEKGTVRFTPPADQSSVPERYRLEARSFDYQMSPKMEMRAIDVVVDRLQFPSAVKTASVENNTVHAEYYRPSHIKGKVPGVVVLDITGGDQSLSRVLSTHLARNGVACLFVQMAYYGPRRPPNSKLRLLSTDLPHTMAAIRQTVLDLRLAAAWLASRPEIDAERIGILGTSLGSLVGSLTAEMEPRFRRCVVLLGGGGFVDAFWDDPRARTYRQAYELIGGTKEKVAKLVAPVDPITCAANLKECKLLILAAKRDEILPPSTAEALWKAAGQQKIVWYDCTHYGGALHIAEAMEHIIGHLTAP